MQSTCLEISYLLPESMTLLNARNLSLSDVQRLLGFQRCYSDSFSPLLTLESLTDFERQDVTQIRNDFDSYLADSRVLEGMVKVLTPLPLMRLAGFYHPPLKLSLEEEIDRITLEDKDTHITGRFDILSVNKAWPTVADIPFWVLLIEAKNSDIAPSAGLVQLLAYAYQSLERQESVWGLTTNGQHYQFVYLQAGSCPTYSLMPFLTLMEPEPACQILQVLKAIGQLPQLTSADPALSVSGGVS